MMRIQIPIFTLIRIRIRIFHFDADPDPNFYFDADPDPDFHFDADTDPVPHQSDPDLRPMVYRTSTALYFDPPRLHCEPPQVLNFYFDPDTEPASTVLRNLIRFPKWYPPCNNAPAPRPPAPPPPPSRVFTPILEAERYSFPLCKVYGILFSAIF